MTPKSEYDIYDEFNIKVKQNTPRLVVKWQTIDGKEAFEWGVVNSEQFPLLSLIGAVCGIQSKMQFQSPPLCPDKALVIIWDTEKKRSEWFIHVATPTESMCGMLETIKTVLVGTKMAQHIASQQMSVLGPDGEPTRRT